MKKVLLVGAGPIEDDSFLENTDDFFFVACDAGYRHFMKKNIVPDLFVGDFDTLGNDVVPMAKEIIRLDVIKDDTDTIYAVRRCLEKGYDEFFFHGCLGGKIEHTIANIQTLSFLLDHSAKGFLVDEKGEEMIAMIDDGFSFPETAMGMLSIFSYEKEAAGVTLKNLMYTLENATLTSSFPLGVSNQFIKGKSAQISVKEGKLLLVTGKKNFGFDS